jgi:ABC-type transport system substrate-binding protein
MKHKLIWVTISFLIVFSMVLLSCTTETTTTSSPATTATTTTAETTTAPPISNWWDKYGEPQYGGTITQRASSLSPNFDNTTWFFNELNFYWDVMFVRVHWTIPRDQWSFNVDFTPEKYCSGQLAESWDIPDLQTVVVNIRQGVHFQDKEPVNGRELTSDDVQKHYDRILGTGSGYTAPSPMYAMFTANWDHVTATGKYSVEYKFIEPSAFNLLSIIEPLSLNAIEAPEWVALGGPPSSEPAGPPEGGPPGNEGPGGAAPAGGPLADWKNAVFRS